MLINLLLRRPSFSRLPNIAVSCFKTNYLSFPDRYFLLYRTIETPTFRLMRSAEYVVGQQKNRLLMSSGTCILHCLVAYFLQHASHIISTPKITPTPFTRLPALHGDVVMQTAEWLNTEWSVGHVIADPLTWLDTRWIDLNCTLAWTWQSILNRDNKLYVMSVENRCW